MVKEIQKMRPIKNIWHDWLISYIPEPIRKSIGGFKNKVISLFKRNTPKHAVYGRGKKLNKLKTQKQSEENIINRIKKLSILKKETKDRIIRGTRTLF